MGIGRRLGAIGTACLAQDASHVIGGRVLADHERRTDLAIAQSARDEVQNLRLAGGEPVRKGVCAHGRAESGDPPSEGRHADSVGQRLHLFRLSWLEVPTHG